MKKNIHLILGIIGLGLVGYGISQPWSGVHLPRAGITISSAGYEMLYGQIAIGLAALTAVMLFVRPKIAGLMALTIILSAGLAYLLPKTDKHGPQIGLFIAAIGALVIATGSMFVPKKARR